MLALTPDPTPRDLALYIHWPFCQKICPYCDFNVARHRHVDEGAWQQAFLKELEGLHHLIPQATIPSIFFGGGTPSLMPPQLVQSLIDKIAGLWTLPPEAEITLEANPTDAEAARYRAFAEAGVTRLSLGLQALHDTDLKMLGRWHSACEALAAFETAQTVFANVSCDLIYGRPGQTTVLWREELSQLLARGPQHLSLYQLTIEPGTAFERAVQRGTLVMPDDDVMAALYDMSQELCEQAGMPAYEISNHASPAHQSRHNLAYWRYQDYAGLGPGAHGRLTLHNTKYSTLNIKKPADWLEAAGARGAALADVTQLTHHDQATEFMLMGLRLREGLDLTAYDLWSVTSPQRITDLCDQGLIVRNSDRLRATRHGRRVLNYVLEQLLA